MSNITYGPKLGKLINANANDVYTDAFRVFLRAFDQLVMGSVISNSLTVAPSLPSNGDAYIVGSGATGAWLSKDNQLAVYSVEITTAGTNTKVPGWEFYTPQEGWELWVINLHQKIRYTSLAWTTAQQGFADEEVPSGVVNGTNTTFAIAHTPNPPTSFKLYADGVRLRQQLVTGGPGDYTLTGTALNYITTPPANSHFCDYRY